ncbi:hypothetical protein IKP85_01445 [bacterium]|nr:hypothetical protein [bacterium]
MKGNKMDLIKEYEIIQTNINKLTRMNTPVDRNMRIRQIQILEQLDDEFVKEGKENIAVYKVRLRYNAMLKYISDELGLPVKKYVENIKLLTRKMGIPADD